MTEKSSEKTEASSGVGVLARPGGISYVEIPAVDAQQSAAFYKQVFGWNVRVQGAHVSFDDASGYVSGAWSTERSISREPGVLPYIYVDRIDETLAKVTARGGEVVRAPYPEGDLWVATLRDPAGNVIGVWQQGPR